MKFVAKLQKLEKKNEYRIVMLDKQKKPQSGKTKEIFGTYNVKTKKTIIHINKLLFWLPKGVMLTNRIEKLLFNKYNFLKTN